MTEKPKFLALGQMPRDALAKDWLAAGPWCFCGQEKYFPDWEHSYTFAPEALSGQGELAKAASAAQTLALMLMPKTARLLDKEYEKHAPLYWETLLLPWLLAFSRQIVERSMRLNALLASYEKLPLQVELLPECEDFEFEDESAFTLQGCLNPHWNHWLLSRLLEERWPTAWLKSYRPCVPQTSACKKPQKRLSMAGRARSILARWQLELPFPKLKGMGIWQAFRYSLALRHPCHGPDASLELNQEFLKPESLSGLRLPASMETLLARNIPQSLKRLDHSRKAKPVKKARLRVASVRAHEDAVYRQKLALWRESGNRLAFVQHGCNYGQVAVACDAPLLEYSQAAFFSWGWDKYSAARGNFLPMPYPGLPAAAKKGQRKNGQKLIFVGTEMAAAPYRLDSRPGPLQFLEYRQAKADFFSALPEEIRACSLYRPYFDLPGCLDDAKWLLPRFPDVAPCPGPLWPYVQACRILVLDHPGTTMLEALAAGIPMILYWNMEHWPLGRECDRLLAELEKCGIWSPDPALAARQVAAIWEDPLKWHSSAKVQEALAHYASWQAKTSRENPDAAWVRTLEKL